MIKNIKLVLFYILIVMSIAGCYYDVEEELYPSTLLCDTSTVTYSMSVEPIINANCYGCHSTSAAQGGVVLDSHATLKGYAVSGELVGAIKHDAGFSPMPKGGAKLSSCNISIIEKWINDGSLNN